MNNMLLAKVLDIGVHAFFGSFREGEGDVENIPARIEIHKILTNQIIDETSIFKMMLLYIFAASSVFLQCDSALFYLDFPFVRIKKPAAKGYGVVMGIFRYYHHTTQRSPF